MNQIDKLDLIDKIRIIEESSPRSKEIVISLDDYFKGNDETFCNILANTLLSISSKEFETFLRSLIDKVKVLDIFICLYDYEEALEFDDMWINSDTIYIVTTANVEEVTSWFEELCPSSIDKVTYLNKFANLPNIPDNYEVISVWWD